MNEITKKLTAAQFSLIKLYNRFEVLQWTKGAFYQAVITREEKKNLDRLTREINSYLMQIEQTPHSDKG